MHTVYIVQHVHELDDDEDEDAKIIGVYSTKINAEKAVSGTKKHPGFNGCQMAIS